MRKILTFTLMILFLLPIGNVFAESNLLMPSEVYFSTGNSYVKDGDIADPSVLWDGNNSTGISLSSINEPSSNIVYKFNNLVDIETVTISSVANRAFRVLVFNDTGEMLYDSGHSTSIMTYTLDVTGGFYIVAQNRSSLSNNITEFTVLGNTSSVYSPITKLIETNNYNSVTLSWSNPNDINFNGVIIKKDGLEITELSNDKSSYDVLGLDQDTQYKFDVIAKYSDGGLSDPVTINVLTDSLPLDTTPPGLISNLNVSVYSTLASFSYAFPSDSDFSHVVVYRNGEIVDHNETTGVFTDEGLIPNTTYTYKFVSVDYDGNMSSGYIHTIRTELEIDNIAPSAPSGLSIDNANGAVRLYWQKNEESDLKGYNIYIDGIQINDSLVFSNYYVIPNLSNGESYNIQVTAVDTSLNESPLSNSIMGQPDPSAMPIFETSYTLKDVVNGITTWFDSLWLILAFAVGIPLAFYVGHRLKMLILS